MGAPREGGIINAPESSPMLDQYRRIKREHQNEVLFFRLGDFYEMFSDDAIEVSSLLNLTLTNRNGLPMCGVPFHAARSYIARLLRCGKKVAICEQLSEPRGRGVIERQVVEVVTPGTTVDEDYLEKGTANYLAALASTLKTLSFAYIDISTGEFNATCFPLEGGVERLRLELERLQIREIVVQESLLEESPLITAAVIGRAGLVVNRWADWLFDGGRGRDRLEQQFGTSGLRGFGLESDSPEILAAGALLDYLDDTARALIPHVRSVIVYGDSEFVGIDESSQRNLELVRNIRDGDEQYSLLEVMDETRTGMGRRFLRWRVLHPLRDTARISRRLDMVELLYRDQARLGVLRELLGKVPDLERLCSRLAMDRAHGKDMAAIKNALGLFDALEVQTRDLAGYYEDAAAASLNVEGIIRLMKLRDILEQGLAEDPPILLTEGNLIRERFYVPLDELRMLKDNGRQLLEDYLEEERQNTGILTLKIKYNRLIGYYFEVASPHLSKVPPYFIRRQGLAGGERFTTDRLAGLEADINGASDRIIDLERKLFLEIRDKAKALLLELAAAARRIAEMDTAQALARAATIRGWVRPQVDEENRLHIIEGRHPVVEVHLPPGEFIPNDTILDEQGVGFALITGPNMAGKSTYLRQTALITLMAQMGSFVPAREAQIGLVDRVYCRVGASDNLARGESTFLMEMNETAYILHTATAQSLVIMDEVGRGTGTNDGLSIAWAVSEELLEHLRCRTLFATHYHELALISHPRMANRSMEVRDQGGEIHFLRKIREGPAEDSYGIHAARLAGLPEAVLNRAERILQRLKFNERTLQSGAVPPGLAELEAPARQVSGPSPVPLDRRYAFLEDLMSLNPDRMTPVEALNRICAWKKLLSSAPKPSRSIKAIPPGPSLFDS